MPDLARRGAWSKMPPSPPETADASLPDAPAPHWTGHRARLRARFRAAGPAALADYELLEILLFRAIPRRDVKPIAKALIARFGTLAGVIAAPVEDLTAIEGVSDAVAIDLKLAQAIGERAARQELGQRTVISSWAQLLSYCRLSLAHEAREQFRVLFLDRKNQLIADELMGRGTVDHAPVYPREIAARALALAASAVILVHNHPSGDPNPSRADIDITREIAKALAVLDIAVHDHLVVGRQGVASFRSLNLL